jgi:hypothetical protein
MAFATYTLQVDWNNDGDFGDAGEDVTARLLHVQWERGRDYASALTGRSKSAKLRATLDNTSGDYSSFNTSSPLTGKIVPGRKVRLDGGTGSFPYTFPIVFNDSPHFVGYLQRIIPIGDLHGKDVAILEVWGALGQINQKRIHVELVADIGTGAAFEDILEEAGLTTTTDFKFDTGQTTIKRFWLSIVDHTIKALRQVEWVEGGFIKENKDGVIEFEDRHHRLKSPHTTSQATFSDASGAARTYSKAPQQDAMVGIFNEFDATVQTYTVASSNTVLWTLAESGADSPLLAPRESKRFWAVFPNPDSATDAIHVDSWAAPVATTDYITNTVSDGSGTDHTADTAVSDVEEGPNIRERIVTNNASVSVYLTLLQVRGKVVTRNDPVRLRATDTDSQTAYGKRNFTLQSQLMPDTAEGQSWADYHLSIYKDPIPIVEIWVNANRDHTHLVEALSRDISDRITLVATNDAGLGINEDFFIEAEKHVINSDRVHWVRWRLSPASGYSNFWILNTSALGTETVLAY